MLNTTEIEQILENFNIKLSKFDIVNMEEKKGWSSRHLYLIVEKDNHYILKGKTEEQLAGYLADINISEFLETKGYETREQIPTKTNEVHHVTDQIYWDLKTYIPGSVLDFEHYDENSIKSLAKVNLQYINHSLNNQEIMKLDLTNKNILDIAETKRELNEQGPLLTKILGDEVQKFIDWFGFAKNELVSISGLSQDYSIIHNDLNNKNILLDLNSNEVISFIDWDHGCIASPLKDILEPINTYHDYVPDNYDHMRKIYLDEVKKYYNFKVNDKELELLQVFLYAVNKWKYIFFYAKLVEDLGDSTNELSAFYDVIKTQVGLLNSIGSKHKVL